MPKNRSIFSLSWLTYGFCFTSITIFPRLAQAETDSLSDLDIPPQIIKESPVLQKWLQETPNVLEEIRHDPSFRSRLNLGFSLFPSNEDLTGVKIAVEDIFLGRTGLTWSADYQTSFNSDRVSTGTDLHYFIFPLGNYINVAPLVGYRYVQSNDFNTDGVNLGLRLMFSLSRTGSADISIAQSFISPQGDREVGLFSLSVGYSITSHLRLSTDWKLQNSQQDKDDSFSIGLQYLL
ncbi:conserved hypothetical protein [Hyella patelloides LEGE 07179]|uniref:Uncharacterized protein n=1 Tax=Hyella patelloides LEGE 07179 TaxID=945734 RepID=A0A563W0J7_9CYAN|nr:hypothetical protein [Hyella patelloides]VEP17228.1 conserved hypothetical protein [Hyella patelloides LEGE 07179]